MAETGRELGMFVELVSAYVARGLLTSEDVLGLAEQVMVKAKTAEPPRPPPDRASLTCSFCAKSGTEVGRMVSGPEVHICDECIRLASELIAEQDTPVPSVRA
ncbi:MAG: ClpX C4-type zinc finger protein [Anaeromyxobacteraceae bacterium]